MILKYKLQLGWYAFLARKDLQRRCESWNIVILSPMWTYEIKLNSSDLSNYEDAFHDLYY